MNWRNEWDAIGARIDGVLAAGHFLVQTLQVQSSDTYGVIQHLSSQTVKIVGEIEGFSAHAAGSAPESALEAISTFLTTHQQRIQNTQQITGLEGLRVRLAPLAWLRAEVDYHLRDFTAVARKLSERAFLHLQQTIVADDVAR
jgi:hypothetical protein